MPSFPGSAGDALPPESVTNPSDVRSSERPVFRRRAVCDAYAWGTCCRRFAAWWGGDAGSTPRLVWRGCREYPTLTRGVRAVAASRLGVAGMPGIPHAYAWGYVLSALRGLVLGMPGVPHAYAWGYILSALRGLN